MRPIPKSRIQENLYTNGTGIGKNIALRYISDKAPYIGFYNIVNGNKYSTGKTFDDNSKLLEKYNIATSTASTIAAAGSIPTIKAISNSGNILSGNEDSPLFSSSPIRYFYKNLGTTDILIKEIDKNAYNQLTNQPSSNYQVISYNSTTQTLEEVNTQMPGLAAFLGT
jgi:hypothetical protein